ncbi:hypothetical protein Tco_0145487 [Tanacetum coccineum]
MYRPSYEPASPSLQPNQEYSLLNHIKLDMDMENLFNTQDYFVGQGSGQYYYAGQGSDGNQEFYTGQVYSMGQGSAHGEDDSPVKKMVAPVKAKKVSKRCQKTVTTENKQSLKPRTTAK